MGFLPRPIEPYPVRKSHAMTQPSMAHVASSSGPPGDQLTSVTARSCPYRACSMGETEKAGESDRL